MSSGRNEQNNEVHINNKTATYLSYNDRKKSSERSSRKEVLRSICRCKEEHIHRCKEKHIFRCKEHIYGCKEHIYLCKNISIDAKKNISMDKQHIYG
ncbi:hypothetical protein CEXT_710251 [Caerostris extrusa]|uniref:Uncharacterized protein n=1 Tax=Caerostris extrusa TaxID=172846 RepID=A0AAV4NXB5_CAEEX|nr:hypothetical protein CEXT_710251 [Caerostris extrusa]